MVPELSERPFRVASIRSIPTTSAHSRTRSGTYRVLRGAISLQTAATPLSHLGPTLS